MENRVQHLSHPGASASRRRVLLGIGGAVALGLDGCGGGGGDAAPAATPQLKIQSFTPSAATAAAVVQNPAGGSISVWTSGGLMTQSLYQNSGRTIRTYYGASQEVLRVVDERSGEFVVATPISGARTDYSLYAANGAWKSGWAVLLNADGTYSTAQIVSSGGLLGKQITGNLSGAVVASYTMLPDGSSGLGTLMPLGKAGTTFFASLASVPMTVSLLNRLTDALFKAAYAQSVPSSSSKGAVVGAFWAAAGAIALASAAGSTGLALLGVGLMGYGAYRIYNALAGIQAANLDILDSASNQILGNAMGEFTASRNPVDAISSTLSSYLLSGSSALSGLPSLSTVVSQTQLTASTVVSNVVAATTATWQQVTSSPPVGTTGLTGVMVDNSGQTYQLTGAYNLTTATATFDTGTSSTTRITGTGSSTGGTGTYTAKAPAGTTTTGAVTIAERSLGACQTQQSSGGQGAFSNTYDLGRDSGTFTLSYDMYTIPDRLQVMSSTGQVLYTTGGLVSGAKTVQIPYSGGRIVFVVVSAPTSGTAWDYTIGCPT